MGHQELQWAWATRSSAGHGPTRGLAGIDPARFEPGDLARLPVMTKEQMMGGFDEVVTDRRLTRARVERHLAASAEEPSLLFGRYVCLASGGSSGLRGLFVQTTGEYAEFVASVLRRLMARVTAAGGPPPGGLPVGIVAAASPVHSSGFGAAVAVGYPPRWSTRPARPPAGSIWRSSPTASSTMRHWPQHWRRACARRACPSHRCGYTGSATSPGTPRRARPGASSPLLPGSARSLHHRSTRMSCGDAGPAEAI